jgi:CheY-like chemotaxis protein
MPDHGVILLAEDREDDILLIRKAFEKGNLLNPVQIVRNGEEVVAYLKGEGKFSNRAEYPLPALLILDLKMPLMDGFEVIQWVRAQPSLAAMRIVVLTSSNEIKDANRAYHLGANSFLVKPDEFYQYVETCKTLKQYWLHLDQAPEVSRPPPAQRPVAKDTAREKTVT